MLRMSSNWQQYGVELHFRGEKFQNTKNREKNFKKNNKKKETQK